MKKMIYKIHLGIGIENARENLPVCKYNHEFLAELVELIEQQPQLDIVLSNFDINKKYIELAGDYGGLEKLKRECSNFEAKESIKADFECFILACDKALENNMNLYLVME